MNEAIDLNYYQFYVVDTLYLIEPINVYSGERFYVCERSLINRIKINKEFFERSDVFLTDSGEGLYWAFDYKDTSAYNKYPYPDYKKELVLDFPSLNMYQKKCKLCDYKRINIPTLKLPKKVSVYEYDSDSVIFILGLMNIDFYNKKYTQVMDSGPIPIEGKSIKDKFVKMVFPICIDENYESKSFYQNNPILKKNRGSSRQYY